jgi:hypothetical protein
LAATAVLRRGWAAGQPGGGGAAGLGMVGSGADVRGSGALAAGSAGGRGGRAPRHGGSGGGWRRGCTASVSRSRWLGFCGLQPLRRGRVVVAGNGVARRSSVAGVWWRVGGQLAAAEATGGFRRVATCVAAPWWCGGVVAGGGASYLRRLGGSVP